MNGYGLRSDAEGLGSFIAALALIAALCWGYATFVAKQDVYTATVTVCRTEDSYTKAGHEYVLHLPNEQRLVMDVEESPLLGKVRRDRLDTEFDFTRMTQDVAKYGPTTYDVSLKGRSWFVFGTTPNVITYKVAAVQAPELCKPKEAVTA